MKPYVIPFTPRRQPLRGLTARQVREIVRVEFMDFAQMQAQATADELERRGSVPPRHELAPAPAWNGEPF